MKTLIVYYSRTNTTGVVAESLSHFLSADVEQIIDTKNRMGPIGYINAGRDGMKARLTKIKTPKSKFEDYDLVIIGTPVWAWNISSPIRTFLKHYSERFSRVAFFCTRGGSDPKKIFDEMSRITGKNPIATLSPTTKEVRSGFHEPQLRAFVEKIKSEAW